MSAHLWGGLAFVAGCGSVGHGPLVSDEPAPLFSVPLHIGGESVGPALIDTGGGYEVMLRANYDLTIVGTTEVLAFGGRESVSLTEGFVYSAGGYVTTADYAIVGASICDCNGLGYHFFRDTGIVLGLDFGTPTVLFETAVPAGGTSIPFERPPSSLEGFDSAFVEVEISYDGASERVLGLLDTGAARTVFRRGLIGATGPLSPNQLDVRIAHESLGTVALNAALFDTPGLPDLILGTDLMRAWASRWYFSFAPEGGRVTVFLDEGTSEGIGQSAGAR